MPGIIIISIVLGLFFFVQNEHFLSLSPGHTDLNKMRQKNPKTLPLAWQIYSDRQVPCHNLWHLTYLVWHTHKTWNMVTCRFQSLSASSIFLLHWPDWQTDSIDDWNIESVEWVTHHNNIFHCQSIPLHMAVDSCYMGTIFLFSSAETSIVCSLCCAQCVSHFWRNLEPQWSQTNQSQTLNQA